MAQVAVQGPSEAPIWVQGATASAWYEVGSATRCERVSAVRGTCTSYYCNCKCVPFDAMHNSTQSLSKGCRDSNSTAFRGRVLLFALQPQSSQGWPGRCAISCHAASIETTGGTYIESSSTQSSAGTAGASGLSVARASSSSSQSVLAAPARPGQVST